MREISFQFTSIHVTKRNKNKAPVIPATLTFDRKTIYVSSANYSLKLKDVSIDKSFHESRDARGRREKCAVLVLQNDKVSVEARLSNPTHDVMCKFDDFVEDLEGARMKFAKRGNTKEVISVGARKRVNTITPARGKGLYLSPRKSPGRIRLNSPLKTREEVTRGNVVTTYKERGEMKLPPKSPRRATPSKKFVEPREKEVKRSVFSQEEYEDDLEEDLVDSPVEEPKRKRLSKLAKSTNDDNSDVEFDPPTAKKKLRLGDEDETPSPEDRVVWMGMNSGIAEGEVASEKTDSKEAGDVTEEEKKTAEKETKKAEVKPLFGIFAKQTVKQSKSGPKSDTFGGAIMSSPKKSTKSTAATPPPSAPERAPALKQVQRTGIKSRYFMNASEKKASPTGSDEMYETDEENLYEDSGTPYERPETDKEPPKRKSYNRTYSKLLPVDTSRLNRRRQMSIGGRSANDYRKHMQRVPREGLEDSSPAKRLDFAFSSADKALNSSRKLTPPQFKLNPSVRESEEPTKPIIPGIQNLGNTCYLSASLQTLFGIPNFLKDLYSMYNAEHSKKDMPLTKALLEVAVAIGVIPEENMPKIDASVAKSKLLNSKAANPSALKKQMDVLTDKFVGYEQRDAHEFLSDLVDYLHEELVAEEKKEETKSEKGADRDASDDAAVEKENKENDTVSAGVNFPNKNDESEGVVKNSVEPNQVPPTDDYFHLKVRVCLECDACKYSRSKEELYRHLSIDVGEDVENDPWTVKRGLDKFFQPETRELKCEKCSDGATATQTIEIISCPKALLLHFKRFIVTQEARAPSKLENEDDAFPVMEMVLKKNKAKINLEDSLSIPIFATEAKYNLRGVVHHVGNTAFSGHYTACGLRSNTADTQDNEEQWVYFDDRKGVMEDFDYVAKREKNQRNCYMAIYELK